MSSLTHHSILQSSFNCVAALALFTSTVSAQADQTKTENFTYNLPLQSLTSAGNFNLPAFDQSLGTLKDLKLTLSIDSSGLQVVYDANGKPVGFKTVTSPLSGSIAGPGELTLNANGPTHVSGNTTNGRNIHNDDGTPTNGGGSGSGSGSSSNQTSVDITDPNALSQWETQGGNPLKFSYNTAGSGSSSPNTGYFPDTFKGTAKVSVSYTYDVTTVATPEPRGEYLTAVAAAGMMLMLVRRRQLSRF